MKIEQQVCNLELAKNTRDNSYERLNNSIGSILASLHENIHRCLSILYLLRRVKKDELFEIIADTFNIKKIEIELVVNKLIEENVLGVTLNFYILDNEQLGLESLDKILNNFNLEHFIKNLKNKHDLPIIFSQLAKIDNKIIDKFFTNTSNKLLEDIKIGNISNDDIFIGWKTLVKKKLMGNL